MNVMLFGASGLVGRAIVAAAPATWRLTALTHSQCDVTDRDAILKWMDAEKPAVVINAAGFTGVDAAEDETDAAIRANAVAPGFVARACSAAGARLIHLSSDYVFDGRARSPYREDAPTVPLSAYGRSKLEGEHAVRRELAASLIVRTQWVFGAGARSLVAAMCERARRGEPSRVVHDQHGRPTYAADLASVLVSVADRADVTGVLHVANEGVATSYELAVAVYEHFGRADLVTPVPTSEFPTRAVRPAYSVLALDRLHALGFEPRDWRTALAEYLTTARRPEGG